MIFHLLLVLSLFRLLTSLFSQFAADVNEISFQAGEEITQIEKIDDGWWQGYNSQNAFGMFPANFVTINDGSAAPQEEEVVVEEVVVEEPVAPEPVAEAAGGGSTAVALYDYTASKLQQQEEPTRRKRGERII